jgi:hypothetical protein
MPKARITVISSSTLLLAFAFSVIPTFAATAAEGDDLRGFPALESEWYVTQPGVGYEPAAPHGQIDESMKLQGLDASYFLPSGGALSPIFRIQTAPQTWRRLTLVRSKTSNMTWERPSWTAWYFPWPMGRRTPSSMNSPVPF